MHANVADTGEIVFLLLLPCFSSGPICAKKADFDAILPRAWTGRRSGGYLYDNPSSRFARKTFAFLLETMRTA